MAKGDLLPRIAFAFAWIGAWYYLTADKIINFELFSGRWFAIMILGTILVFSLDYIIHLFSQATHKEVVSIYPISHWRPLAIMELKRHYDYNWEDYMFKAGCMLSVPAGELWVENKFQGPREMVFCDVRVGAQNIVVSPLLSLMTHEHSTFTKSKQECAKVYLQAKSEKIIRVGTHEPEIERTEVEVVNS